MTSRLRAALGWVVRAALTVAFGALVATRIDGAALAATLRGMSLPLGLLGVALFSSTALVIAVRWRWLLRLDQVDVSLGWAARVTLEGFFFGLAVPSSAGMDVYRVVRLRALHEGTVPATTNVLASRALGLLSLCGLGVVASVANPGLSPGLRAACLGLCGAVGLGAVLVVHPTGARVLSAGFSRLGLGRMAASLVGVATQLGRYLEHPGTILMLLGLSVLQQLVAVVAMWVFARAIGVDVTLGTLLLVMPVAWLMGMVPALGGFGPREGSMVLLLEASGVGADAATAIMLLGVVATLGRAALGGVSALLGRAASTGARGT